AAAESHFAAETTGISVSAPTGPTYTSHTGRPFSRMMRPAPRRPRSCTMRRTLSAAGGKAGAHPAWARRPGATTTLRRKRMRPARRTCILLNRTAARPRPVSAGQLAVAVAVDRVVVHHAHGLHEGVADRRDEPEPARLEIPTERVRFRRPRRQLRERAPAIHPGGAADEAPYVGGEGSGFPLHGEKGAS